MLDVEVVEWFTVAHHFAYQFALLVHSAYPLPVLQEESRSLMLEPSTTCSVKLVSFGLHAFTTGAESEFG